MESDSAHVPTLPPFPREGQSARASWPAHEQNILDMLDMATGGPNGLLGHALSAPDLTRATGTEEPHVPATHPGEVAQNASQTALTLHKYKLDAYLAEQKAIKRAKNAILASLSDEALSLLKDPVYGVRRLTLRNILDVLKTAYGTMTAHDLEKEKLRLAVPHAPNAPIREYTRLQTEVAHALTAARQPLSEAERVLHLRAGVRHHPPFAAAVQHYLITNPTVATQTFQGLAAALAQAEDNGDPTPTTGSTGYAAASIAAPEPVLTLAAVTQLIEEAVAKALQGQKSHGRPSRSQNEKQYCWTHGPCSHNSPDCRAPAPGHVREATAQNRRGGATVNPRYAHK